ncbi:MAG: DUF3883 domain-containing protein [Mycobacteriales bacterium]|nr:DUF3883 domain-containing protein [Mycobacteriales bacterium]
MSHADLPPTAALTNRQVEAAAIEFVIAREAEEGRVATDTRYQGEAGDVVSGDRVVEVKAFGGSARGADLWLETRQVEEGRSNPNFWLYLVENIRQGDPAHYRLLRIGGEQLQALLARAREKHYFEVPFPVAVYDATLRDQAGPTSTR